MPAVEIGYRDDVRPPAAQIAALYAAAPLIRPVTDLARIARMYAGSTLVMTAWLGPQLVGIVRGWTDGAYDGYICDLAVHPDVQSRGVGRELLRRATAGDGNIQWVLRASKIAADYYRHLGWQQIENGWFCPRDLWQQG